MSFALLKIFVKNGKSLEVTFHISLLKKISLSPISVPCVSNSDCTKRKGSRKVCQESPESSEKSCQKPNKSLCEDDCEEGQYCSSHHVCKDGNNSPLVQFVCIVCPVVTCSTSADCSAVPGREVCREVVKKGGSKTGQSPGQTCQPPTGCNCKPEEVCGEGDKCKVPGSITKTFGYD